MPATSTAVVKLNGQILDGAIVRSEPQKNADGKLHGEFIVPGLCSTHNANAAQFGGAKQSVGFTRDGVDCPILGASVQIEDDGKTYIGRVVAVSNERVEWDEV